MMDFMHSDNLYDMDQVLKDYLKEEITRDNTTDSNTNQADIPSGPNLPSTEDTLHDLTSFFSGGSQEIVGLPDIIQSMVTANSNHSNNSNNEQLNLDAVWSATDSLQSTSYASAHAFLPTTVGDLTNVCSESNTSQSAQDAVSAEADTDSQSVCSEAGPSGSSLLVVKPKRRYRPRADRDTHEYQVKRERNNVAVKKSREKAKQKSQETEQRVKELQDQNNELTSKLTKLTQELGILRSLFTNAAAMATNSVKREKDQP